MKLNQTLALLALLTSLLSACGKEPAATAAPEEPALTVAVTAPKLESWPQRVPASGHVAAWQEAIVGSELGGVRLDEVRVNVGDRVQAGQVLARFNEDSLRADLQRLDAAVTEADANRAKAEGDVDRAQRLVDSGAISNSEWTQLKTNAAVMAARVQSAQAQRDAQALQLRRAKVLAPDDGIISARTATVGAVTSPGAELFRLIRRGRLEWRAAVPANALPLLRAGSPARLQRPDGSALTGTLRQASPTVDASTLTGLVYVDLPADSGLAAGMFVSGDFELDTSDALTVPESALVFREGHRYVMKVDAERRVHQVKVQTGRSRDGAIEVTDGVGTSDQLVVSGGAFLNDGDLVQLSGSKATASK